MNYNITIHGRADDEAAAIAKARAFVKALGGASFANITGGDQGTVDLLVEDEPAAAEEVPAAEETESAGEPVAPADLATPAEPVAPTVEEETVEEASEASGDGTEDAAEPAA